MGILYTSISQKKPNDFLNSKYLVCIVSKSELDTYINDSHLIPFIIESIMLHVVNVIENNLSNLQIYF